MVPASHAAPTLCTTYLYQAFGPRVFMDKTVTKTIFCAEPPCTPFERRVERVLNHRRSGIFYRRSGVAAFEGTKKKSCLGGFLLRIVLAPGR